MPVSIVLPSELVRFAEETREFESDADTVGQALNSLFDRYPKLRCRIVSDRGELFPYLPLFLNGRKLPARGFSELTVVDDDRLEIVVVASGG